MAATLSRDGLVSVVMPSFNAAPYIECAIMSVLCQSYSNLELIVTDDRSTDNTLEIVGRMCERDRRVVLLRNDSNQGTAVSRNRALEIARGRFVAFLDSDDIWVPNKLERQLSFMGDRNAAVSFTAYQVCNQDGTLTSRTVDTRSPPIIKYNDMLAKRATMGCSTVMIDQSQAGRLSMPLLRSGQDYATWLKLLRSGIVAHRLADVLTYYRIVSGSVSRNKARAAARQWRIYRRLEGLHVLPSLWYFANYAYRTMSRA